MTSDPSQLLNLLHELSLIDSQLALILSERKKREADLLDKANKLKVLRQKLEQESKITNETRNRYKLDEMNLKHEQERLVERRKALSTLGNAKAQQAAQREIEAASRQLELREDEILNEMLLLEEHEKKFAGLESQIAASAEELGNLERDSQAFFSNNDERRLEKIKAREEITKNIPLNALKRYDAIAKRHSMDAVVAVVNKQCSGCHVQIGPQIMVKISKGSDLVECPGCGRVLWLGPSL